MDKTQFGRAYRAYHAIRNVVVDTDRVYLEFVEGDPTKVFDEYPGLVRHKDEYVDVYMTGAHEATDTISKHLHELYDALIAIEIQMNTMAREAAQ